MLKDVPTDELVVVVLGLVAAHEGKLTYRHLDRALTSRLIAPTNLRDAIHRLVERGWADGQPVPPDVMPRFTSTAEGRRALGERPAQRA